MRISEMSALALPAVQALEEECFAHPWSLDSLEEAYNNPAAHFLVAKDDNGTVVGYMSAYLVRDEAFVNNVAVTASCRRQGIGSALVERMLELVQSNGASFLSLEVRMSNTPAYELYKSFDFEVEGVRKNFYRDPDEDAFIMTKTFDTERPDGCGCGGFQILS